jgi:hypothetical protein
VAVIHPNDGIIIPQENKFANRKIKFVVLFFRKYVDNLAGAVRKGITGISKASENIFFIYKFLPSIFR